MLTTCPVCGTGLSLDTLIEHDEARETVSLAFQLPGRLGKLLVSYMGLFRPGKRYLTFSRMHKLMSELLEPIENHRIRRNGTYWPASDEMWEAALQHMLELRKLNKLDLPLKSHGYLFEVIAGYSSREAAQAEKKQETERKYRALSRQSGPVSIGAVVKKIVNQTPEGKEKGRAAMLAALGQKERNEK